MIIRHLDPRDLDELLELYRHLHVADVALPDRSVVDGHASRRRKGYATALLRRALEEAWSANCYKVMLLTGRMDESTFRFYESAGFDRHGKQGFVARPTG